MKRAPGACGCSGVLAKLHATVTLRLLDKEDVVAYVNYAAVSISEQASAFVRLGTTKILLMNEFWSFTRLSHCTLPSPEGQLQNACVALAKDWRTDKYLRRLEVGCGSVIAQGNKNEFCQGEDPCKQEMLHIL